MTVKILEVCKVTPSPGSSDICLPLSFFDLLWLRSQPVEYLFFYENSSHPRNFFSSILPKLKHSLSISLLHFFPIAGNLIWPTSSPNPIILYKEGDGVFVTVVQSDDDFFHFSSNNLCDSSIFQPFIANINISDSQARLIAIKATYFPNQGFCIGITLHHAIFDMKSFTMFMKTWTSLSKLGEYKNLKKPVFDRKLILECDRGLEKLYLDALLKQNRDNPRSLSIINSKSPFNSVRGAFRLSGLDVKRLKKLVHAQFGNSLSTFLVTYAYLIVCLVKAKVFAEKVRFSIVVDCRARLEPPILETYFGNCLRFISGEVEREKLVRDDGIRAAVYALKRTIKKLDDGVLKGAEKWLLSEPFGEKEIREANVIFIAGSTRLNAYDMDFGWGRPKKVDISSIYRTGAISLVEGRDGDGGVEIELCLEKAEMEKFASAFSRGLPKINPIKPAL